MRNGFADIELKIVIRFPGKQRSETATVDRGSRLLIYLDMQDAEEYLRGLLWSNPTKFHPCTVSGHPESNLPDSH